MLTDADPTADAVQAALARLASPRARRGPARFFKTGPGQYGEGDVFIGVTVPDTRAVVARFADCRRVEVARLLASAVHEHRLAALLVMVRQFEVGEPDRARATTRPASRCTRRTSTRCVRAA